MERSQVSLFESLEQKERRDKVPLCDKLDKLEFSWQLALIKVMAPGMWKQTATENAQLPCVLTYSSSIWTGALMDSLPSRGSVTCDFYGT